MKIKSIGYKDTVTNWEIEKIWFKDITLLVGISGVGKTQILRAINNLKSVVTNEKSLNGVKWCLNFDIEGIDYIWEGEFDKLKDVEAGFIDISNKGIIGESKKVTSIIKERLTKENRTVFERDGDKIVFNNQLMPKFNQEQSILNTLSNEDEISIIINEFEKIHLLDFEEEVKIAFSPDVLDFFKDKIIDIHVIRNIDIPIVVKLALAYKYLPELFNEIKENFIDVFSQVEDIRFSNLIKRDEGEKVSILQIKERGTDWISQHLISSGMVKTLMHIAKMRLVDNNSVILIDEFENSLGINCIDAVAEDITYNDRGLQFIITSHHPYIINNIHMNNWQIVMRKGAKVFVKSAEELNLGKSKHEAFKQLINSMQYQEGIS